MPSSRLAVGHRPAALAVTALLAVSAAVVISPPTNAHGATRATTTTSAAAYARAHGYKVGIAVIDTDTGDFYGGGDYTGTFASESVVKVFIAARLIIQGRMRGSTAQRAYTMITRSDDGIASSFYGSVGGDSLINWVKDYFDVPDLGSPPHRANWWGNTHIRPKGLVKLYAKLKKNRRVGPWLLNAMHHAAKYGSDGTYQFFGLPSATKGAAIKQGWGLDYDDWSRSADFNTTGFVGSNRYAVAILARGPSYTYGSRIGGMLTQVAKRLLPHGAFPAPLPTISKLSTRSGRTGGGTGVVVWGNDFTGVTKVYFGSVAATGVHVLSRWRVKAFAPPHAASVVHVRVATSHGTTRTVPNDRFSYVHAPVVTSVSPAKGDTGGGTVVTVHGTDFRQVSRVLFGSKAGTSVKVDSPTSLRVTSPAGAAGTVAIRVVGSYGTSASVNADRFTYVAPPPSTP